MIYSHVDNKGIPLQNKIVELFNEKQNGFFIELGANDGLFQSNTAYLEKFLNWTGILIEPSITAFHKCLVNRPNSLCYNLACVSNDYKEENIEGDFSSGSPMSSINGERLNETELIKVKTSTLDKIISNSGINNFDFMSLDVEGYELEVLKGMDLNKNRPTYMLIEIYNKDYNNIVAFLENKHYKLHSNFTNYNKEDVPLWDGTHNDYLFVNLIDNDLPYNNLSNEYLNQISICSWKDAYYGIVSSIINDNNFKNVAEIGIGYGQHALNILDNTNIDSLILIDPLQPYGNDLFPRYIEKLGGFEELLINIEYILQKHKDRYKLIRKPSQLIENNDIIDNSLDLVFIDGDHSYEAVTKDLEIFYKKIRKGGIILGDDYMSCHPETKQAVDDFVLKNNLEILFITKNTYPIYMIRKL